jgi:hypothetical protein
LQEIWENDNNKSPSRITDPSFFMGLLLLKIMEI